MKDRVVATAGSPLLPFLTLAICIAVLALAVYGYRAVREWRHSSAVLVERATRDGADLLVTAITRDMHGAQALVLANRDAGDYATQTPPDFSSQVSAAFSDFRIPNRFSAGAAPTRTWCSSTAPIACRPGQRRSTRRSATRSSS